jgi:hypothetical protein
MMPGCYGNLTRAFLAKMVLFVEFENACFVVMLVHERGDRPPNFVV